MDYGLRTWTTGREIVDEEGAGPAHGPLRRQELLGDMRGWRGVRETAVDEGGADGQATALDVGNHVRRGRSGKSCNRSGRSGSRSSVGSRPKYHTSSSAAALPELPAGQFFQALAPVPVGVADEAIALGRIAPQPVDVAQTVGPRGPRRRRRPEDGRGAHDRDGWHHPGPNDRATVDGHRGQPDHEVKHAEHRLVVQHRVTRILAEAATVEEAIPRILEMIGKWPGWDLGVLWQNDRQAGVLRCAELWRTPSLEAPQFEAVTRRSTFSPGSGLPGRVWASGAPAHIPDVARDPDFPRVDIAARESLHGAFAFPILLGRDVLGVIGFFSRDVWQADQDLLDMMATIGNQIGQFTKRAAAVDELQFRVSMLQQIPVAAWSVTPDGTPDIVNQLWYEYTGQTPEFVNSHPEAWMATLHPEDRERASRSYWDGIRSGRGFTMEARFLRARDGTYRWHLNRAVPVLDPQGNIVRFVGTSTDVHELAAGSGSAAQHADGVCAHDTRDDDGGAHRVDRA